MEFQHDPWGGKLVYWRYRLFLTVWQTWLSVTLVGKQRASHEKGPAHEYHSLFLWGEGRGGAPFLWCSPPPNAPNWLRGLAEPGHHCQTWGRDQKCPSRKQWGRGGGERQDKGLQGGQGERSMGGIACTWGATAPQPFPMPTSVPAPGSAHVPGGCCPSALLAAAPGPGSVLHAEAQLGQH